MWSMNFKEHFYLKIGGMNGKPKMNRVFLGRRFRDLNENIIIDGRTFRAKDPDHKVKIARIQETGAVTLKVKFNNPSYLDELQQYLKHINILVTKNFAEKNQLATSSTFFAQATNSDPRFALSHASYLQQGSKGALLFRLLPAEEPKVVQRFSTSRTAGSIGLGALLGLFVFAAVLAYKRK